VPASQPIFLPTRDAPSDAELVERARDGDRFIPLGRHATIALGVEGGRSLRAVDGQADGASAAGTAGAYVAAAVGIAWAF